MDETQNSLFSIFRPWPKRYFRCFFSFRRPTMSSFECFSSVVGRRQSIFIVFCISSPDARRFSGIFAFPRGWKGRKWVFLSFQGVGNAENGCFCLSKGLETQKLSDSGFPRGWKVGFFRFPIKNCDFTLSLQ